MPSEISETRPLVILLLMETLGCVGFVLPDWKDPQFAQSVLPSYLVRALQTQRVSIGDFRLLTKALLIERDKALFAIYRFS